MTIKGVINHFLIGFEVDATERTHAYCKSGQEFMALEAIGQKGELATIVLQNDPVVKLSS